MRENGGREASRKRGKKKTLEFDANELEVFHTLQGTSVNPQASTYATRPQNYVVIRGGGCMIFVKFSQFRIDYIIITHRRKTLFKVRYET